MSVIERIIALEEKIHSGTITDDELVEYEELGSGTVSSKSTRTSAVDYRVGRYEQQLREQLEVANWRLARFRTVAPGRTLKGELKAKKEELEAQVELLKRKISQCEQFEVGRMVDHDEESLSLKPEVVKALMGMTGEKSRKLGGPEILSGHPGSGRRR